MDWERARVSAEVLRITWAGRIRTLLRAAAVGAVALGGWNLFIGPPVAALGTYRVWVAQVTGTLAPTVADIALIALGLVAVLVLSALS